jgi:putative AdoMet-dependent methyltransferase
MDGHRLRRCHRDQEESFELFRDTIEVTLNRATVRGDMSDERTDLFDRWAGHYDQSVGGDEDFPFAGYEAVLDAIVEAAAPAPHMAVLDVGIGTGNLAERLLRHGCELWGLDFSAEMLERAREKLPDVHLVQADLRADALPALPQAAPDTFDRIVSAYVWHEFDLAKKVALIRSLARDWLDDEGYIVIGDISFATDVTRREAHVRWQALWDETEHYWAADEAATALRAAGFDVAYRQISICGGVYVIRRREA